ncbi:MAG TPA: pentapeptide repeat-containing protein [Ktedonobacteraceae bacterium]|jgi:uncharacterized protein YjbI with pentapeptide repeats|nr:pentapeptide repeat-containing protein [Ktedonobacteraceae bacterium]
MANEEHLDILRQGVEVWNKWRKKHSPEQLDLSNADLRRTDLSNANLSGTDLIRAELTSAILVDANLSNARQLHFFAHRKNRHER